MSKAYIVPHTEFTPMSTDMSTLLDMLSEQPAELARWVGGKPWGIVCRSDRVKRFQPIAKFYNLTIIPNDEVRLDEGFVLIHYGERNRWMKGAP